MFFLLGPGVFEHLEVRSSWEMFVFSGNDARILVN